ncbi:MAG: rod shape-determining protein MreD [Legionellales bacterium]|nr:rod shape-determining protein MreD [Legionellales bacterium]
MQIKSYLIIIVTFIFGFVLSAIPLPDTVSNWRPSLVPLILIYWCMALPNRFGIKSAWFLGMVFDVQKSFVLGQHAIGFIFLAYIILKNHKRIRVYPLPQQAMIVFIYLLIYKSIMLLIMFLSGSVLHTWSYWLPIVTSVLLWPFLFLGMRYFRRRYNIS